jgi:DNA-binding transcriptional ArsR family regulator
MILHAVAPDLGASGPEQLGRWRSVARDEPLHVRGGRVARRSGVDDDDTAPRPAEHERRAQSSGPASDDHNVIGVGFHALQHARWPGGPHVSSPVREPPVASRVRPARRSASSRPDPDAGSVVTPLQLFSCRWQSDSVSFPHPIPEPLVVLVARRFHLLGEPMRLRLLDRLRDGEATVQELADAVGASQQNVSRHLALLTDAGVLARRKDGTHARYRIDDDEVLGLCEQMCGSLEHQLRGLAALVEDFEPEPATQGVKTKWM